MCYECTSYTGSRDPACETGIGLISDMILCPPYATHCAVAQAELAEEYDVPGGTIQIPAGWATQRFCSDDHCQLSDSWEVTKCYEDLCNDYDPDTLIHLRPAPRPPTYSKGNIAVAYSFNQLDGFILKFFIIVLQSTGADGGKPSWLLIFVVGIVVLVPFLL